MKQKSIIIFTIILLFSLIGSLKIMLAESSEDDVQAIASLQAIIEKEPTNSKALIKLAQLYNNNNQFDLSIINYRKALILEPHNGQLLLEYANTCNLNNDTEIALQIYQAMSDIGIKSFSIHYNIAYTLKKLGRYNEAIAILKKIIEQSPDNPSAHFTLATSLLTLGNYKDGWQEYEWRWKQGALKPRIFAKPLWDGTFLAGKTLLLHAEQGLGDTFQFIRFAKRAKELGGHVIAAVQPPLVQLLSLCPYLDSVISLYTKPLPRFDFHAPLLSLPRILQIDENRMMGQSAYLYADKNLEISWRERLDKKSFNIGICWQGNPNYSTHMLRAAVASKSLNPAFFAQIAHLPGIKLYSLQKMHATNIEITAPLNFTIESFDSTFDQEHGRFMDTAAVMKNLDLIITVDTSIAHLAGGLAVPVWVMLPKAADWRWLIDRQSTPWYKSMRLFRQQVAGNWDLVIEDMVNALKIVLGQKGGE